MSIYSNVSEHDLIILRCTKSNTDDDFGVISKSQGAHEIEKLNNENKRNILDEEHFTEAIYPFTIKPNFATVGIIIESSTQGSLVSFLPHDSIGDL